jgi:glycosyltransferase involved in cell wall biosynthesis
MDISVVIRCKDEEEAIGRTLQELFVQEIDIPYEVVLVDSGSTDRTLEIARKYPVRIFQIPPEAFSFGYALNYGIEKSESDIIVNISAHCVPAGKDWLSTLVAPIREGRADAVYGRQVPVVGLNPFEEVSLHKHFPQEEKADGRVPFSNANCAFVRKMWDEVKFDEAIASWEDYLWYLLRRNRFVFRYVPDARVIHSHAFSVSRIARTAYIDGQAFRYIKDAYDFDVLEDIPSLLGKLRYATNDLSHHAGFFIRRGYLKFIFTVPFVRLCSYINYWRGYHRSRRNPVPLDGRVNVDE